MTAGDTLLYPEWQPAPDILFDEDGRFMGMLYHLVDSARLVFRELINVNEYVVDDMGYYTDDDVGHIRLSSYRAFVKDIKPVWYRRAEERDEWDTWGPNTWLPQRRGEKLDARFIKYWGVPE